jgi:hypothetical protein
VVGESVVDVVGEDVGVELVEVLLELDVVDEPVVDVVVLVDEDVMLVDVVDADVGVDAVVGGSLVVTVVDSKPEPWVSIVPTVTSVVEVSAAGPMLPLPLPDSLTMPGRPSVVGEPGVVDEIVLLSIGARGTRSES